MTDQERLIHVGESLATMLGQAVAALDGGEPFSYLELQLARTVILRFHEVKALASEATP